VAVLSALLAAAAIVAILVIASLLWRAVGRWEAAAMADLALDDHGLEDRLDAVTRTNGAHPKPGHSNLVAEQALASSIAEWFADEGVEEITVEHPEGDVVVLHPTEAGGWR
jgi:hypothetical protein